MGARFLHISVLYFVLGVLLGLYMSMAENFTQTPVHVHVSLLGWVSLALAGLVYGAYPKAADHVLAKLHFWSYNIGLPLMMVGLFYLVRGVEGFTNIIIPIGSILVVLGVILFALNVWMNVRKKA